MEILLERLIAIAFILGGVAGVNFTSVESIKNLVAWLEARIAPSVSKYISLGGFRTFVVSVLVAFFLIAGLDINVFGDFSDFAGVDPMVMDLVQTAIVALLSNRIADGKAEKAASIDAWS